MFMWTVGYTVGDMMYIAQTTADQRRANWLSKALWLLALACFLTYAGYQVYLSYLSYTNPDWSSGVTFADQLDFPTVLICPMTKRNDPLFLREMGCRVFNETEVTTQNCTAWAVVPTSGRFKGHQCALFNGNVSNIMTATIEEHSFMEIKFEVALMHLGRVTPFAVILYSPTERSSTEAPSEDSPKFLVVADTAYWAVLSQEQDAYIDGPTATSFYASTSSSVAMGVAKSGVVITFSYSDFAVSCYQEVVTYDWLSLVGVLGGAAAFACAVHEVVMLIFMKSISCCCPSFAEKLDDGEEEEEAEQEEKKKKKDSCGEAVPSTSASNGKCVDSDEESSCARSLQSVEFMHNGFVRTGEPNIDHYGHSPSSYHYERRPLLDDDGNDAKFQIN